MVTCCAESDAGSNGACPTEVIDQLATVRSMVRKPHKSTRAGRRLRRAGMARGGPLTASAEKNFNLCHTTSHKLNEKLALFIKEKFD
jgi:hypothetical protein